MTEQINDPAAQGAAQEPQADLTINDLNAMKMIIDVASSRGTFKPNEMMMVGQTYQKLATFLETVAKQQAAQPAAPTGV